jgi:hypothetical protein
MNWNFVLIGNVLMSYFRRRRELRDLEEELRERRRREQERDHLGRIVRRKLIDKMRQNPLSVPATLSTLQSAERDTILCYGAYCLAEDEEPSPSLDSLAPGK